MKTDTKAANELQVNKELYPEYRTFCNEDGMTPFKKLNFIKQLRALNLVVDRVSQNQLAVFVENNECDF